MRDGGKIYVNGRYVESLLLNGKEFFKGNSQVMLDNLAAYTVKDIQVYEKQSDEAHFLKQESPENMEYVMDVKLKKEYNAGWILNAEGGYGTDNRYLGRLFGMNYSSQNRFTFIANANNLGIDRRPAQESASSLWQVGRRGKVKVAEAGFDYNVESSDAKLKAGGNAYVKSTTNDITATTNRVNFMPGGDNYTYSRKISQDKQLRVDTWHELKSETDYNMVKVTPNYNFSRTENNSGTAQALFNTEISQQQWMQTLDSLFRGNVSPRMRDSLINQSRTLSSQKSYSHRGRLNVDGTIKFSRNPDWISYRFRSDLRHNRTNGRTQYLINYGDPEAEGTGEQQRKRNRPDYNASFLAGASYNYVVSDKVRLTLNYDYSESWKKVNSSLYTAKIKADATGRFDVMALEAMRGDLDPANSYKSKEHNTVHNVVPTFHWKTFGERSYVVLKVPMKVYTDRLHYRRGSVDVSPRRTAFAFDGRVVDLFWSNYKKGCDKQDEIRASYDARAKLPSLESMIDMVNDADPLNIYLGNPDLKTGYEHSFAFRWTEYKRSSRSYKSIGFNSGFSTNALASGYSFNPATGVRTYKTYNVDGNWNVSLDFNSHWYFGKKQNWMLYGNMNFGYNRYSDMIGSNTGAAPSLYRARTFDTNAYTALTYEYKKMYFDIGLLASWTHADKRSAAAGSDPVSVRPNFGMSGTIYGPLSVWTQCAAMIRTGYSDPSLNTTSWVWNATLTYAINKNWKLMVDGFDILGQLSNVVTTVNSQGRSEVYYNTLPRYVMLRCQYTVNISPKKKLATIPHYW